MAQKRRTGKTAVEQKRQYREEIAGLVVAALGVFFIVCIFTRSETSTAGVVGAWFRDLLFGLFGLAAYVIPFGSWRWASH
jgi:hypothetical protein